MAVIAPELAGGSNVVRMLDLIAWSEGTSDSPITKNNGYDVIVSGVTGPEVFTDYSTHPFEHRPAQIVRLVPRLLSTAAGRYQLLQRFFEVYKERLKLPDFSPLSQDIIAVQQMKEKHAIELLTTGNIESAIESLSNVWASLPGNNYNQGGKDMQQLLEHWKELYNA